MACIYCPNLRYKETKKGGFLGIGAQGIDGEGKELQYGFMAQMCKGVRDARPGDNPRYVEKGTFEGEHYEKAPGFLDCRKYITYGIRN